MSSVETWDVIVVGAGVAGLTSAALLANDGARVLLLEGHDKPGGCAGYYESGGYTFDVGATVLTGMGRGDLHPWVFHRLNVPFDAEPLRGVVIHLPDRRVTVAKDPFLWRAERRRPFPDIAGEAERFWVRQERVADAMWRLMSRRPSLPLQSARDWARTLRAVRPADLPLLRYLDRTVGDVLEGTPMGEHRAFRAMLDQMLLITVQETAGEAAFLNGCVGIDIWRHGAFRARGGMRALSEALLAAFRRDGGDARFKHRVTRIQPVRGGGFNVSTKLGETFLGLRVIADVPVWNLPGLLETTHAPRPSRGADRCALRVARAVERAGKGWGACCLYIGLRESALPGGLWLHHQVLRRYDAGYEDGESVFISLGPPGDAGAPPGRRTLNISTHTEAAGWFSLPRDEYEARKEEVRRRMLDAARTVIPDLDEGIEVLETATPRSWEVFTQRRNGQVGGLRGTPDRLNLRALHRQETGLKDFWLVGDTTFPGQGTVAATLSGITAWRDISRKR
jgi:C-3',4' desaturase CrtD